jgi:hypothetical protein
MPYSIGIAQSDSSTQIDQHIPPNVPVSRRQRIALYDGICSSDAKHTEQLFRQIQL